jgi:hypothetical protein
MDIRGTLFRNTGITQNGDATRIVSGTPHPTQFLVPLVAL